MRILLFGSDKFSVVILSELHRLLTRPSSPPVPPIRLLEVVTPSCKSPTNRSGSETFNPVQDFSERNNLKYHFWEKEETRRMLLSNRNFDIGVVASFGRFIPTPIINTFPRGIINMHGSWIPKYRGAAPIEHAILNGDTETGLTIMELSKDKFDQGNVLSRIRVEIPRNMTAPELRMEMAEKGKALLLETLINLEDMRKNPCQIDESLSSNAPKLKSSRGKIEFSTCTCENLHNMHRALVGRSGLWCILGGKRVKLLNITSPLEKCLSSELFESYSDAMPGDLHYVKESELIGLKLADGWAGVRTVHLESKSKITAKEFNFNYLVNPRCARRFY